MQQKGVTQVSLVHIFKILGKNSAGLVKAKFPPQAKSQVCKNMAALIQITYLD